nr:MAG TPA: hypothetical protein [Caudoviricetes sp.]
MQEPLYSLSWQATVRPGKRVSLAPRFFTETNKESGARPPVYLEASASSSSTAKPPLLPFACYGVARNLKFRPSENAKTAL